MASKFSHIFFDLDGTLTDSFRGIEKGIVHCLEKSGFENIKSEDVKRMIGIPLVDSLKKFYFGDDEEGKQKAIGFFREYYGTEGLFENDVYPGIAQMLEDLQGKAKLYIVTAKPTVYAKRIMEHHKLDHLFEEIMGCEMDEKGYKKSNMIAKIDCDPETSVMIGDKKQDIIAGKESGIKSLGVMYGYGTSDEMEEFVPDYIANDVKELTSLLL